MNATTRLGQVEVEYGATDPDLERAGDDLAASQTIRPPGQYLPQLDGLRGVAITIALINHFVIPPDRGLLAWVARNVLTMGWIGVDLFFALSGYLITGILLRAKAHPHYFRNFFARRVLRIFPLYSLLITIVFLLSPVLPFGPHGPAWPFVTYTSNYWALLHRAGVLPTSAPYLPLAHAWSLAIEEQFYVTLPFLVLLLEPRALRRVLWAVILLSPVVRFVSISLGVVHDSYFVTFCRLDVLAMGALIAVGFHERTSSSRSGVRRVVILCGVLTGATILLWLSRQVSFSKPFFNAAGLTIVDGALALLVYIAVVRGSARLDGILQRSPLRALGRISYGVYLIHFPVVLLTQRFLPDWLALKGWGLTLGIAVISFGGTLALAALSWRFFERPLLGLKRAFQPEAT